MSGVLRLNNSLVWRSVFMTLQLSLHLLGLLLHAIEVSMSSIFYVFIVIETLAVLMSHSLVYW